MAGIKSLVFEYRCVLLSMAASLGLHTVVAIGILGKNQSKPPQREELVVELIGMVSTRQVEQKQQGEVSPSSTQKAAKKMMTRVHKASNPVKAMARPEKTKPEPQPQSEQQALSATPPVIGNTAPLGSESPQMQQILKPRESEASLIRAYLAGLKREIQNHLDYPDDARDIGNVGAPTIRFTITESGDILPGSLSIYLSSGSAQLDEQAIRAAQSSAPMAKPPRPMTVTIKVAFIQDK